MFRYILTKIKYVLNTSPKNYLFFQKNKEIIDYKLGLFFYGNQSGFVNNYTGRSKLSAARSNRALKSDESAIVKKFNEMGILKMPISVEKSVLDKVINAFNSAMSDKNLSTPVLSAVAEKDGVKSFCTSTSSDLVPELNLLLTNEIRNYIELIMGKDFQINYIVARRTEHVPPNIESKYDVYSNTWHFDNEPANRVKLFIALSDIEIDSGPLNVFDRVATKKILRLGFKNRDDYGLPQQVLTNSPFLTKMTGPAGTCFFASVTQ
jgi:hypothetical protein